MPLDKANIQFLINNNSCELKVHSKNKYSDEHVIKIVERNVNIDYSVVFKNVFDKFIDKFSRDVMYKIIHEILPVTFNILSFTLQNKSLLHQYSLNFIIGNLSKSAKILNFVY
jgi:hypothetical protein